MRKPLSVWLQQYGESHANPVNRLIHKVCVPAIFFSLLGLLWDIQLGPIRLTWLVIAAVLPFYFMLGQKALLIIIPQLIAYMGIIWYFFSDRSAWPICLSIFTIAWIGQFIGHKIEGRKPSFFEDLQFLLIGPLWVVKRD